MKEENKMAGLWGTICIVLLVLKVLGLVDVSWWIITSPIWLGALCGLIFGTLFGGRR